MDLFSVLVLLGGLLILGCVLSSKLSSRWSMPGLLIFLLIGVLVRLISLHDVVLSDVNNRLTWRMANHLGTIALCYILFSGGFESSLKEIKKVLVPGTLLSTMGVLMTALLLGGACFALRSVLGCMSGANLATCLLFGAIISSTDAAAVFTILRSRKVGLKGDLRALLEFESGSNDPMATFLTLFFLGLTIDPEVSVGRSLLLFLPLFAWKMLVGLFIGWLFAQAAVALFNHSNLDHDGLYYVMGLSVVLLTYSVSNLSQANGFVAVYAAGVFLGNRSFVFHNSFIRFSNAISWLMQVVLFTMLGFMVTPSILLKTWWQGLLLGGILMFVVRPIMVYVLLGGKRFSLQVRALVSWVGLRGGAPIMLATFPMLYQDKFAPVASDGYTIAMVLFHLVFWMVLFSVACQSYTIMPWAKWLKLDAPLRIVPTAPISFDRVSHRSSKGRAIDQNDYADNRMQEFMVLPNSRLVGRAIKECALPQGVFVIMVQRGQRYIVPRGETILQEGDTLTALGIRSALKQASELFEAKDSN
ncbi:MAG: potassium/proton antiporter [Victivallales bacterium]|nr:potassium/proton antiporter [Victivallales bacterium]